MKEASINAKQAGERGISAKSVKKMTEVGSLLLFEFCWISADIQMLKQSLSKFKG